jgi:hypothetical protein
MHNVVEISYGASVGARLNPNHQNLSLCAALAYTEPACALF